MELRHLRYFAAVAETRHFGQAADNLHMAQPPLSQQIRQLEAELGVQLLARTTRHVSLTAAGEVFYADAIRILKSVEDSTLRVKQFAEGKLGVLRIGFTSSASYRQLPQIARILQAELPGVALEIHSEMLTPAQEAALVESELDIAVLRPPIRAAGVSWRLIARERLMLALSSQHPLVGADSVHVADLKAETFIMYPASSHSVVNDAILKSCLSADFYPTVGHESEKTSTMLALVAAGLGIALVPEGTQAFALEGVTYIPLVDPGYVDLAVAWRDLDKSPLVARFLELMEANNIFVPEINAEDIP